MKYGKLETFNNGSVVGNFKNCLFNSKDNDIGILHPKEGEVSDGHFHKKHTEYNIILDGIAVVDGETLHKGDIFIYEPYDKSNVRFLSDTILIVIKNPSTKNDKHYE